MFIPDLPVEGLTPAVYNPRKIAPDVLEALCASIKAIGFAKPIIVNDSGTIIAGHQRTKAAGTLGMKTVPAFQVKDAPPYDEVMFNQLHNGVDVDEHAGQVRLAPSPRLGFEIVQPGNIHCPDRMPGAYFRSQICRLVLKYGNWCASIATQSGKVVASRQAAASSKALRQPLRVFRIPDELEATALMYTSRQYGEYSYDHLERSSWVQTLAQPFRLRNEDSPVRSRLYEDLLLKEIDGKVRVLDFGCGQGDYVDQLTHLGHKMTGVEFFFRVNQDIDTASVHRMIARFCGGLSEHGLYDMTICDSVLNSVVSLEAQSDVLTCLSAFTKRGGPVFVSSRRHEQIAAAYKSEQYSSSSRTHHFFTDQNGFTANMKAGAWFFQKYHKRDELVALVQKYVGPVTKVMQNYGYWLIRAARQVELPRADIEAAIAREFNLDWPSGLRVNRHQEALAAWHKAAGLTE